MYLLASHICPSQFFSRFYFTQLDQVLAATHMPIVPCILCQFIIPFSPVCCFAYCKSQRTKNVQDIFKKYNGVIAGTGYSWYALRMAFSFFYIYFHCSFYMLLLYKYGEYCWQRNSRMVALNRASFTTFLAGNRCQSRPLFRQLQF